MIRSWLACALGLGLGTLLVGPGLQAQVVEYSWRTRTLTRTPSLRSGQTVTIRIIDISPLCYDYEIAVTQFAATEALPGIIGLFTGSPIPEAKGPATGGITPLAPSGPIDAEIQRITGKLATAASLLNVVREKQVAAGKATDKLFAMACPAGAVRGPGVDSKTSEMKSAQVGIQEYLTALSRVSDADKALMEAGTDISTLKKVVESAELSEQRKAGYQDQLEKFESLRVAIVAGSLAAARQIDKGQVESTLAKLNAAGAPEDLQRIAVLRQNTESLTVVITAKGRPDVATTKGTVLTDPLTLLVRRRHRAFLTAGFLASTMDQHHYARVNRSAEVASAPDSTFSTIADKSKSGGLAFAPAVMINTTLGQVGGVDLGLASGVAVRTAGRPDFLVGLSLSIADRVLVTPTVHIGRVERLLLGRESTVKKGPVPPSITIDDAVGEYWRGALALVVSYRL